MSDKAVGIPIGAMNNVKLILGLRGYGKSTYCAHDALTMQGATGAYVIGHSLGARFPANLPDGTSVPVDFYPSIEKLKIGLRRNPTRIAILVGGNGDEVIRYARELSFEIRRRAYYREHGWARALTKPFNNLRQMDGIVARPIIVIVDEGVAMSMNLGKTGSRREENKEFREAIYGARHEHIGYLFQIQDPNAIGPVLQTQATNYVVFRIEHQWALNAIGAMGATREDIQEIRNLEVGEYVEFGPAVKRTVSIEKANPDLPGNRSEELRQKAEEARQVTEIVEEKKH